eukprot:1519659-Prymnesium_polylepis.1
MHALGMYTGTCQSQVASETLAVSVRHRSAISGTDWVAFYPPEIAAAWTDSRPTGDSAAWTYLQASAPYTEDVTIIQLGRTIKKPGQNDLP